MRIRNASAGVDSRLLREENPREVTGSHLTHRTETDSVSVALKFRFFTCNPLLRCVFLKESSKL